MKQLEPFYRRGLRFRCTRCSACCRHTPGYVFLSEADIEEMRLSLSMDRAAFLRVYCRDVAFGVARRISLKEKANFDCVFWNAEGCAVYPVRPLQCRSYPFWSASLASPAEWEEVRARCPGIGLGRVHGRREIEKWLTRRQAEGFAGS